MARGGSLDPIPGTPGSWGEDTRDAVCRAVDQSVGLARAELALLRKSPLDPPGPPAEEDLLRVESLWAHLDRRTDRGRKLLVEGSRSYRDWLLCLRICDESVRSAVTDIPKALELAQLALYIARHAAGTHAFRSRLEGYCTAFIGNAQRVAGDLLAAEATFARYRRLWEAGKEVELLSEARLLDLEASLRSDQRRFTTALALHDSALAMAQTAEVGPFLLNKAGTLQEKGEYGTAIELLKRAGDLLAGKQQLRIQFGVRFNLTANLCRLGRAKEAAALLPGVRELAEQLSNDLDLIRTRWLEGNVDSGLGFREKAVAALEEVRADFAQRKLPYDYALASLDLALLYREQERIAEIGEIAGEILAIFRAQEVHREALAAIILFREAVEEQTVSVEMMRRLQDYLGKAPSNSTKRFEA